MITDIAYKLARKAMGSGLYDKVSYDWLGRRRNYERLDTYTAIHRHYLAQGLAFRGLRIIEVGAGLQYFTALHFLADGAAQVTLVEPKLRFSAETLRRFIGEFNAQSPDKVDAAAAGSAIAAYNDLSQVPQDASADLMLSYTVLEHVRDLKGFFAESARLLKPGGRAYHMIDLSDHTYQVFARFPWASRLNDNRALYHLRYSQRMFDFLNDGKCWMNRALGPEYIALAQANGFRVVSAVPGPYPRPVRIHPEIRARQGQAAAAELSITTLALTLERTSAPAPARETPASA